ncbi:MAG: hypothetical protein ACT4PE_06875 [Candidatus Eiseniibacteriota bacterium]
MLRPGPAGTAAVVAAFAACAAVMGGCDLGRSERGNLPPDTAIIAGPPEGEDAGYRVLLAWSGEDADGVVDRFEIAWEEPRDWAALPGYDSTFVVTADSCCGDPPAGGDSTGTWTERFHHVFIRALDDQGEPDGTPAERSFNAKTIAPRAGFLLGPGHGSLAPTTMRIELTGADDDGVVVGYRYTLVTAREYFWDGQPSFSTARFLAWADTLSYHPRADGSYDESRPARIESGDVLLLSDLPVVDDVGSGNLYLLGVRAVDDAGAAEPRLRFPTNARLFSVSSYANGPRVYLRVPEISRARPARLGEPAGVSLFAADVSLEWAAIPGVGRARVTAFRFAQADTAEWSPWTAAPQSTWSWESRVPWRARPGAFAFFVQATDALGAVTTGTMKFHVLPSPRDGDEASRTVLVVLDTDATSLEQSSVLPRDYAAVERSLVVQWFADYRHDVFETRGTTGPGADLLAQASSVVWIHTAAVADGDASVLFGNGYPTPEPLLPAYVAAGGNLFVLGIQLSEALRTQVAVTDERPVILSYPLSLVPSAADSTRMPHWGYLHLGLSRIDGTVPNTNTGGLASLRLRVARSGVPGYPDLPFDPLTWPQGMHVRGFGYYDRGVVPNESGETIYTVDESGISLGVRRLTDPARGGNTVYLGLHPYWVERPAFRDLVRAVLTDFGETPIR